MSDILTAVAKSKEQSPFRTRFSSDSAGLKYSVQKLQNSLTNVSSIDPSRCVHVLTNVTLTEENVIEYILIHSGCRISEILECKQSDLINGCDLLIHGKKGSASRIFHFPELSEFFLSHRTKPSDPIFHTCYITFYRHCLERGIFLKHRNSKNRSVTHSFRYKYIHALNDVARDEKEVADCVGHRSRKTSHTYLQKEK